METTKIILIGVYLGLFAIVLLRMLRKNPMKEEYERLYNEVLTSKKYRVKSQFEKDE